MANEAVIIELINGGEPIRFTCADAAIEKGALLMLSDPRTAAANTGSGDAFAGIAAEEKIVDGKLSIAAYTKGIFDLKASSGTIAVGAIVSTSGANLIKTATEAEIAAGKGIGKALEAFDASEVGAVFVYPVG